MGKLALSVNQRKPSEQGANGLRVHPGLGKLALSVNQRESTEQGVNGQKCTHTPLSLGVTVGPALACLQASLSFFKF